MGRYPNENGGWNIFWSVSVVLRVPVVVCDPKVLVMLSSWIGASPSETIMYDRAADPQASYSRTKPPVELALNPSDGVNGVSADTVYLVTSSFHSTRDMLVIPVEVRFIPNIVPRTAATAESVCIEKSLRESFSALRCGASAQVSQDLRKSFTLVERLLSVL